MKGVIIRFGQKVVVAVADTTEDAEDIALDLFAEAGIDLDGVEVDRLTFETDERGGILLELDEPPDMEGWSMDGFSI